jgi:hypothetical protein
MTQQRDIERLLDHWFNVGPDQASDRVVDIVTDRIERQSQRPAWRLHWRPIPVNTYMKIAVAAATVLAVAVLGYNLLPGGSTGVGGAPPSAKPTVSQTANPTANPTVSHTASPTATPSAPSTVTATPSPLGAFGGTAHWRDNGAPVTTEIDAVASGATVTGTAVITSPQGVHTVRLGCVGRDGDSWAVAGKVEQSTLPGESPGFWSRVVVKDGSPQQIAIWLSTDAVPAGIDCPGFLATFPFADLGPENFVTVESGALVPPHDLAP